MKIKHLTIKIYHADEDYISYFAFYRDNNKHPFAILDGGYCTHEQFCTTCDLIKEKKWRMIRAAIAAELNKDAENYSVINVYPDHEVQVMTTAPVFTAEELL